MSDESGEADQLKRDQLEVNSRLVAAAIEAQERHEAAELARLLAEERARALAAQAELRELFLGVLSHDLRNPLSAIMLAAGHITEDLAAAELHRSLADRIRRSAARMARMIDQLLDLTRARLGGGIPVTPVRGDLGAIVHHVVDEFDPGRVHADLRDDLPGMWDADRLGEVVSNLVGNALQHATPSTVVLIEAYRDGDDAVIAIHNHGEPLTAAALAVMFQPFRRAPGARSTTGNLGLGLFIADQIVRAHRGTITASSAGDVTTFVVRLPLGPP